MASGRKNSLRDARVTEHLLTALEKSELAKQRPNEMTLRLIRTIREAWRERDEAIGTLEIERAELIADEQHRKVDVAKAAAAFAGREKVLVVIRVDGFVECFAEAWIDLCVIEERLSDETDSDLERRMPHCYRELYLPGKLRKQGLALLRPHVDGAAIAKLLEFEARCEQNTKLDELIAELKPKVI